jgi:monofunctional biosynthetic peptidoglycan transglycosylase
MPHWSIFPATALLVITTIVFSSPTVSSQNADSKMIFDFRKSDERGKWVAVNDGVMGGRSQGDLKITGGKLRFSGNLSLENNGGFSSIRHRESHDLSAFKGIRLRVKGDGRTYKIRLETDARYRSWAVSYSGEFKTAAGEWTEVEVPFSSLTQSFRGLNLSNYPFNPATVKLIGVVLADKKPGPFTLDVEWMQAY